MHITSSVFINDDESGLHKDYLKWLEEIAPTSRFPNTFTTEPWKTTQTLT